MASVKDRCKTALDETRTLMLGAQVLVGFQFNAFFQERFADLPALHRALWLATLVGMMISLAAFLAPVPFDRVRNENKDVERFENFVTRAAAVGLLPFALALGADVFVVARDAGVRQFAATLGVLSMLMAGFWWYGIGGWKRMRQPKRDPESDGGRPAELKDKITNVLTEARTALPGAQALLGFQFVVIFTSAFTKLSEPLQQLHVAALLLTALTTVLLIAPAAYHRIADDGEFTEDTLRFSSRAVVASLTPLAMGLCGDLYVVTWLVTESRAWSGGLSVGALLMFAVAWLFIPLLAARQAETDGKSRLPRLSNRPGVRTG